ncbi:Tetraspanin-8 [Larimichthys crocea]|uniref:Uncharacterized protein n=1 Tax=Larimichthys crocea TaxID=215358 RepID=A0ACD3Q6I7_LARCR|nr:Tetraspanin-8 [Larimichthys crocea]
MLRHVMSGLNPKWRRVVSYKPSLGAFEREKINTRIRPLVVTIRSPAHRLAPGFTFTACSERQSSHINIVWMFLCSVHQRCSRRRMPQVKPHLRYLLFGFCIFLVIVGGLVFVVALAQLFPSQDVAHGGSDFEGQTTSHIILYIHGSVTMAIGILGACGAHQRNLMVLNAFLVCTVVEVLLMLRAGVYAAEDRPKLEIVVEERWRSFLPLDQASDDVKKRAEALQTSLHCCGLFSYEDWEQNIPDSCLCNQEEMTEDKCQSVSYRNFLFNLFWQKKSVFRQNCFPFIVDSARTNANVTLAAAFTGLALALLGLVLSSLMIYQINTCNGPNAAPLPVMFVDQPPAYQRL